MYIQKRFSLSKIILFESKWVVAILIYCHTVAVWYSYNPNLSISISIPAVLGTAISLFLGFRTNSAYERWWEARKIWGAVVNDSRTLVRKSLGFIQDSPEQSAKDSAKRIAYLQMAWCYALSKSLRKQDVLESLDQFLTEQDLIWLSSQQNIPNAIIQLIEMELKQCRSRNQLDAYQFVSMDNTLTRLCDSMGMCERIKNTVFPTQYNFFTVFFIIIFVAILPFGLLEYLGYFTTLVTLVIGFTFFMIEAIAVFMQDPFENRPNDTPMTAISRTIEINIRQMLGETELPEAVKPENGVLL
ncbi:hypothetical protein KFE98_06990 [bacterium SCSIO 12741]|nr:hypothetical protein KFE98_06990 [bacterium SCSIO 12741]